MIMDLKWLDLHKQELEVIRHTVHNQRLEVHDWTYIIKNTMWLVTYSTRLDLIGATSTRLKTRTLKDAITTQAQHREKKFNTWLIWRPIKQLIAKKKGKHKLLLSGNYGGFIRTLKRKQIEMKSQTFEFLSHNFELKSLYFEIKSKYFGITSHNIEVCGHIFIPDVSIKPP